MFESAAEVAFFYDGAFFPNFFQQLLRPDSHEVWMRLFPVCVLVGFGFLAQALLNRQARLVDDLRKIVAEKERLYKQNQDAEQQLLQAEKMTALGQLAAGVAHEINNPLAYVKSNLYTLESVTSDLFGPATVTHTRSETVPSSIGASQALLDFRDETRTLLTECKEGIERIVEIVSSLTGFARKSNQRWALVDVHEGIQSMLDLTSNDHKHHCEIVREFGDAPKIECIPVEFNQVILNLLINAGYAIEGKGIITIRTGAENDGIWIDIADTGCGIPQENLNRIFEPFFTTKPVGEGTGLGLSISYRIVQNHGGRIEVQSTFGKGATFRIWLPVKRDSSPTEERRPVYSSEAR